MAISTQLVASLAAGGGASITAATVSGLRSIWGESGKTYLVMNVDGSSPMQVKPGPVTLVGSGQTFLCIEVATN